MIEVALYTLIIGIDRAVHRQIEMGPDRHEREMQRLERIERAEFVEDERRFRVDPLTP